MSIAEQRQRARRRLEHLQSIEDRNPRFNVRSIMGVGSVFDVLNFGTYQQLQWASTHLVGENLFTRYDAVNRIQQRELHVPLMGSGDERGRLEFEVEREHGGLKYELTLRVRNADAGETHALYLDGERLGQVTINSSGFGRLILSTDPSSGEQPFVGAIPQAKLGAKIQVGDILEGVVGGRADSTDGSIKPGEVEIDLFGSTAARGSAQWELDPEGNVLKKEFKVKIDRAITGSNLTIRVDGVNVGQFLVDEDGKAELEFSTDPNFDELPFPANFPEIAIGTVVDIGGLVSGTFNQLPDVGPNTGGTICDERQYQGGLWSRTTSARGGARFEIDLEDGGFLEHEFRVHVRDATPGETHDIRVAGVTVGNITINDEGRGRVEMSNLMNHERELALPKFFPEIDNGTVVEVGNILTARLREIPGPCGFLTLGDPEHSMLSKHEHTSDIAQAMFAVPF